MSGWMIVGIVILVVVLLAGFYLSMTAGRLDHLHRRIDMSRLALGRPAPSSVVGSARAGFLRRVRPRDEHGHGRGSP